MAMTEQTLDLRRRRILEIRHHKIEEKRMKIQTLQKEMSELNEDIPLKTSLDNKNVASEASEDSSSSVVVAVCVWSSWTTVQSPVSVIVGFYKRSKLVESRLLYVFAC